LAGRGFKICGEKVKEYKGKKWDKTNNDLDFVVERDGVTYGSEVKNTWSYINRDEMIVKLDMCKYFGVRPLFIMRGSPKSYNWEIKRWGGYAMIFVAQIYPLSQGMVVKEIKEKLGLEADCPRAIPSGIIDRFINWEKDNLGDIKKNPQY